MNQVKHHRIEFTPTSNPEKLEIGNHIECASCLQDYTIKSVNELEVLMGDICIYCNMEISKNRMGF